MNRLVAELSGVRATALLALYAGALDNGSAHPILGDRWAQEIINRLDFDFTQFRTAKKERYGVGVRTRQMDEWTRDFVTDHPDAIVLDLGAGLDSRVFRVNPPSEGHWYDIDYPDVIELRNRLYPAHQCHDTVGADLTHDSWLDPLPRDRPVAIVADGVFMFLTEQELRQKLFSYRRALSHRPDRVQCGHRAPSQTGQQTSGGEEGRRHAPMVARRSAGTRNVRSHSQTRRGANDHRVTMALPCLEGIPHHLCRHEEHPGAAGAGRAHPALHVLARQRGVERAVWRQRTGSAGTCCTCLETAKALSGRGCHWCRSRTVSTPPHRPDG